jgi:hypothetical protein
MGRLSRRSHALHDDAEFDDFDAEFDDLEDDRSRQGCRSHSGSRTRRAHSSRRGRYGRRRASSGRQLLRFAILAGIAYTLVRRMRRRRSCRNALAA